MQHRVAMGLCGPGIGQEHGCTPHRVRLQADGVGRVVPRHGLGVVVLAGHCPAAVARVEGGFSNLRKAVRSPQGDRINT